MKPSSKVIVIKSKKEVQEMLAGAAWTLLPDLSLQVSPETRVYEDASGRLLVVLSDDFARLYSISERNLFVSLVTQSNVNLISGPRHMLDGKLIESIEFVEQLPLYLTQVSDLFNLPTEKVDLSVESLSLLEPKLKHRGYKKCLSPPFFPVLLAYVGEIARRQIKGQWRVHVDEQTGTHEPWIMTMDINAHNTWYDLVLGLEEGHFDFSQIPSRIVKRRRIVDASFWLNGLS